MTRWRIAAGTLSLALVALATPAVAVPGPVPTGLEANCGARSGNFSSCVAVVNATRGYQSPNTPTTASGLLFHATFSAQGNRPSGLSQGYALSTSSNARRDFVDPANGYAAYYCRIASPFLHGCRTEVASSLASSSTTSPQLQRDVFNRDQGGRVTSWGQVNFRANPTSNCSMHDAYVACRLVNTQGPSDYSRFNFELSNELVTVGITNTLQGYRMIWTGAPSWGSSVEDVRGRSANAHNVEPNGQAWWGAVRPIDKAATHIAMEYRLQGLTPNDRNFQDAIIRIRVEFDENGNLVTTGDANNPRSAQACRVLAANQGTVPTCTVAGASSSVPGLTRLLVSVEGRG